MTWLVLLIMAAGGTLGFLGAFKKNGAIPKNVFVSALVGLFALCVGAMVFLSMNVLFFALAAGFVLGDYIGNDLRKSRELKTERPQYRFCPNCRETLKERDIDGKRRMACPKCQFVYWNNPIPVVSVLVPSLDGKRVLLVKRSIPPKVGDFALPGGFLEPGEDPPAGGKRETKEETGVDVEIDRLLRMVAIPHVNQILIFYLAKPTDQTPTTSSETSEVDYFPWDKLPANIAFPIHQSVIDAWIDETIKAAQ